MKKIAIIISILICMESCTNKDNDSKKAENELSAPNIQRKSMLVLRSNISICKDNPITAVFNFSAGSDGTIYISTTEETSQSSDNTAFYTLTSNISAQKIGNQYELTVPGTGTYWLLPFANPNGLQRMAAGVFSIWCDCLNAEKIETGSECPVIESNDGTYIRYNCNGPDCALCDMRIASKIGCGGGVLFEANRVSINGQVFELLLHHIVIKAICIKNGLFCFTAN